MAIRPVVAHLHDTFFTKSETFIYHVVTQLKSYEPVCLARRWENQDTFPFPVANSYQMRESFRSPRTQILQRALGIGGGTESFLRKKMAKMLHAHFGPMGVFSLSLRRRLQIPLITTFYGYDVSALKRLGKTLSQYASLFEDGDLFLVEGPHMKAKLISLGCPENKIQIQRICIPLERIQFVPRRVKSSGDKAVLVFSGRFVEKKGLIYALQAVRQVRDDLDNFEFRIIGDGPLRADIEKAVARMDLRNCVKMLGFLDYGSYLDEMRRADIFLHPSVTALDGDSEGGAPTTILEAQAMGVPIVSTRHADIPNVVVPGESALLSDERDVSGLADNIRRLLSNPAEWEPMGRAGRSFVEKYHDLREGVALLEKKYDAIL